ncbi:hypothetical protein CRUP_022707, partial [Coryphaenoides rupestris]
ETCKKMQAIIDRIDEERYDAEAKVGKANKEIDDLKIKVVEVAGVKKPALKKVRMSADAMLKALLGSKHTVNFDLRANLKQVKKEVKEEEICKKLQQAIDKIDEDRYDTEAKVEKSDKEISDLKLKVVELGGVKKPALKKVRMSADAMLQALLGGKHKVTMDLRSNLKQVKKEVKEESLMLQIAANWLENEKKELEEAKEAYMAESCPDPDLSGDQAVLMELCKKLSQAIDKIDEDRYDVEAKKPALKKVRMSADAMLQALLGGKHKVTMDLRSNLKQVKKEVKEESLILQIAANWLEQEKKDLVEAKETYLAESCPTTDLNGDQAELMETCKKLHALIDKIDEERYDAEAKVGKADKEIEDLKIKVVDLVGVKKPALKKVRMSADSMLQALLGSKHKVTMDLRSNLKQVKKEVKEEATEAGDWRKNIEDKADRKKMFETS